MDLSRYLPLAAETVETQSERYVAMCTGNVLEVVIGGLQPEAQYQFQVAAYTRKGDGERSRPKKIRTKGAGTGLTSCTLDLFCVSYAHYFLFVFGSFY